MSRMPNFEAGYHKFTFKKARQEADLGCRSFDEPGPTSFTREDVSKFDLDSYYANLCNTFPTLMTPMIAVAASGRFEDGTVEVLTRSEKIIIFSLLFDQMPTNTSKHGPRGGVVDQRTMLALTGSRLLHNCHPRQVNTLAKMTSLHNAVKCLPGQEHRQANRLGDGYSKLESMKLMEGATASFDSPIVALKKGVESLYLNRSASSARALKALAGRLHVNGFSYLVDNVGLVGLIHIFCKRFASTDPGITSLQVLIHCNGTRK